MYVIVMNTCIQLIANLFKLYHAQFYYTLLKHRRGTRAAHYSSLVTGCGSVLLLLTMCIFCLVHIADNYTQRSQKLEEVIRLGRARPSLLPKMITVKKKKTKHFTCGKKHHSILYHPILHSFHTHTPIINCNATIT